MSILIKNGTVIDPTAGVNAKKDVLIDRGKIVKVASGIKEKAKETITKESFNNREHNIWRLYEIMPVFNEKYRFSLGEGWTPLIRLDNLGKKLNLNNLMMKNEGENPTGSFKSR